uniref:AlNc14C398G11342 protein n=1 Tax=Albugo laibachii Nc14 TaxID=890382 RepID=F0WYT2_9STRA|nr:AlNc14C398G11342 [Albugo laibachii Nc14]|eukprot:CCA26641.1 AlNc14C398G11342 [Albugo laibachii Nc14]
MRVLLLLFASIQIETLSAEKNESNNQEYTCAFRKLYEVTVQGENGIYCLVTEPCSGTIASRRNGCPTWGQKDVTGKYTLPQKSCCAKLNSSRAIGCVIPTPSTQCLSSASLSNPMKPLNINTSEIEEPVSIGNTTQMHPKQNRVVHTSGPPITPIKDDNTSSRAVEGSQAHGNAFDVDIIVYMCIGTGILLAIFLGIYLLRKGFSTGTSSSAQLWDESTSYSSVPITPKERIALTR